MKILNNKLLIQDDFLIKEILNNKLLRCKNCIEELKKQEKIDQYMYDKMLMEDVTRELSWRYITKDTSKDTCLCTRIMVEGEITACMDCGLVLEDSEVDRSGDYYPYKVKAKKKKKKHMKKTISNIMSTLKNSLKVGSLYI